MLATIILIIAVLGIIGMIMQAVRNSCVVVKPHFKQDSAGTVHFVEYRTHAVGKQ